MSDINQFKAIAHDRKTGEIYYGLCTIDTITQGDFVTLKEPIRQQKTCRIIRKFKKGITYIDHAYVDFGEKLNDIMISIPSMFIELLNDIDIITWADTTKEAAEKKLDDIEKEAQAVYDAEKKTFLDKKSKLGRFLYNIFN
jgi:hypothetical protein